MKHQPFEDWLLNEKLITAEQKRELASHLRTCVIARRWLKPAWH